MEKENYTRYAPIEVTTHNLYFHEESPILSIDHFGNIVATSGNDNYIRLWTFTVKEMNIKENIYRTATNSSIKWEHLKDLQGFSKPINCVRFKQDFKGFNNTFDTKNYLLAACADSGKVIIYYKDKIKVVRGDDGNDAYDLCWGGDKLIVTFANGNVEIYEINPNKINLPSNKDDNESDDDKFNDLINKDNFKFTIESKLIISKKIHENVIQGCSFNFKNNCLATFSLDNTVKINLIKDQEIIQLATHKDSIDRSRGIFKRLLFKNDKLYLFNKKNTMTIICHPFQPIHLFKKLGPFNAPIIKVIETSDFLIICTKKSVYFLENDEVVVAIDNISFLAISDAFFVDQILFVSSMDGFISSVRISFNKD